MAYLLIFLVVQCFGFMIIAFWILRNLCPQEMNTFYIFFCLQLIFVRCEVGVEVLFMIPYSFPLSYLFAFLKKSVLGYIYSSLFLSLQPGSVFISEKVRLYFLLLDSIPAISLTRKNRQKCKPISIYPSSPLKRTLQYTVTFCSGP